MFRKVMNGLRRNDVQPELPKLVCKKNLSLLKGFYA